MQKHLEKRMRLNNQIRSPQVQVIDSDGKQLGPMATHEALRLANDKNLDLVEVGPSAKPPVVKIMDYGKYMYQKEKKERDAKTSKTGIQDIKTVKIGLKTGRHDLDVRLGQIVKFLEKGYRVKIELSLRGRERQMRDLGRQKLEEFIKSLALIHLHIMDEPPRSFPGGWNVLVRPESKNK